MRIAVHNLSVFFLLLHFLCLVQLQRYRYHSCALNISLLTQVSPKHGQILPISHPLHSPSFAFLVSAARIAKDTYIVKLRVLLGLDSLDKLASESPWDCIGSNQIQGLLGRLAMGIICTSTSCAPITRYNIIAMHYLFLVQHSFFSFQNSFVLIDCC